MYFRMLGGPPQGSLPRLPGWLPRAVMAAVLVVPVLEVLIFLQVSAWWGALNTLAMLIWLSLLGVYLIQVEGRRVWREVGERLSRGQTPGAPLISGLLLLAAGLLLLLPGFLSDVLGLLLLFPPGRKALSRVISRQLQPGKEKSGPVIIDLKSDGGAEDEPF